MFANAINWEFWGSVVDPRPLVLPMTWRRALTWAAYGGIGAALGVTEYYFNWSEDFVASLNTDVIPLMVVLYGYEPAMNILHMLVADRYPELELDDDDDDVVIAPSKFPEHDVSGEDLHTPTPSVVDGGEGLEQRESVEPLTPPRKLHERRMALKAARVTIDATFTPATLSVVKEDGESKIEHGSNSVSSETKRSEDKDGLEVEDLEDAKAESPGRSVALCATTAKTEEQTPPRQTVAIDVQTPPLSRSSSSYRAYSNSPERSISQGMRVKTRTEHSLVIEVTSSPSKSGFFVSRQSSWVQEYSFSSLSPHTSDIETGRRSKNPGIAIVIPCHNSAKEIERTVRAALEHVLPEQIFVMDNGRATAPTDDTKGVIETIDPLINYYYLAETGNKSIAVFCGAHWASFNGFERTLMIDDDVLIPKKYRVDETLFAEGMVKGVVYPILATAESGEENWLVRQQCMEYKLADLEMYFLNRTGCVARPHGACSLWQTETLIAVMAKHNANFLGEDVLMGILLREMYDEHGRFQFRIDMQHPFKTYAPQTLFGKGGNFYQQRVRVWNSAQYQQFWNFVLSPLLTIWPRNFTGALALKNSQLYNLHVQITNIIRFPILGILSDNPKYWMLLGASILLQEFVVMLFNYGKLPANWRSDFWIVLTHPCYKFIDATFATLGFFHALLIGIPNSADNSGIQRRIERGQLPQVELYLPEEERGTTGESKEQVSEEAEVRVDVLPKPSI